MSGIDEAFLANLERQCAAYIDGYRGEDGALPEMMELKRVHTEKVVANAEAIARGENFDVRATLVCWAAARLHDLGRYEQLRRYNTFRDSDSVDHAVFSHGLVMELGLLAALPEDERMAIAQAVLWHNRRDLPAEMDSLTATAARCTRDADKLDIFRVLEHLVATTDWRRDSRAFWNLPVKAAPNPAVVAAIRCRQPVDYQNITSVADFVLIQVGWMASGLEFATSRRLVAERGHLAFRRKFLHELAPQSPEIDELCDWAAGKWESGAQVAEASRAI